VASARELLKEIHGPKPPGSWPGSLASAGAIVILLCGVT
jgi:hypothetical protein